MRRQLIHAPAEPAIERKPFNSDTFCSLFLSVHSAARPNFSSNVCADLAEMERKQLPLQEEDGAEKCVAVPPSLLTLRIKRCNGIRAMSFLYI